VTEWPTEGGRANETDARHDTTDLYGALDDRVRRIAVTPVTADSKGPLNGIPYYLPFTQFELTVSRTLKQCLDAGGTIQLTYDTKVAVVSTSAQPDPGQEYLIDLTSLSSFWKTSDLKTNLFPGGMLQQINASASDQTAQIIQNTASGIGSIAAHIVTGGWALQLRTSRNANKQRQMRSVSTMMASRIRPCRLRLINSIKIQRAQSLDDSRRLDGRTPRLRDPKANCRRSDSGETKTSPNRRQPKNQRRTTRKP